GADLATAPLADEDRRDALVGDVAEALLPAVGERGRDLLGRALEPGLVEDAGPVLVGRVHDAVLDVQAHGGVADALEIAAPPVAGQLLAGDVALDALDDDQPVGRDRADGVAGALGRAAPVVRGAGAPGGFAVGLVLEVGADDVGLVLVALRDRLPR